MDPHDPRLERGGDSDPLEKILEGAEWPEPDPERLARLDRRWRELSPVGRRRPVRSWSIAAIATAAAGLLAGFVLWQSLTRPPRDAPQVAPAEPRSPNLQSPDREPPQRPDGHESPAGGPSPPKTTVVVVPGAKDPRVARSPTGSRPATLYERLAFQALTRRPPPATESPQEKLLDAAIRRRLKEPDATLAELAQPLMDSRELSERLFASRIRRSRGPARSAAVELMGYVGSRRSAALLLQVSRSPPAHTVATRALARLADSVTLGQMAAAEPDADLERELLVALIGRGDRQAVAVYLDLVAERPTREAALAALNGVDAPPVDLMFQSLASKDRSRRTAAALALGSLNDPRVTARLIHMVVGRGNRQEALMALLASSQPDAFHFVVQARRDPLLLGSVRTIEYRLKTL
jgi:hypothetical protein